MGPLARTAALVGLLVVAGCGSATGGGDTAEPPQPGYDLQITYWPEGKDGESRTASLTCDPSGGTHADPAKACAALDAHPEALHPVPMDSACTEIYGGDQVAEDPGVWPRRRECSGDSQPVERLRDRPLGRARARSRASRLALQDQHGAHPEEHEAGDPGRRERDLVEAEEPEVVDEGAHGELAGDEEADGREGPDPRCGERDGEDHDRAHDAVEPKPGRLPEAGGDTAETLAGDEHDRADDQCRAKRAEGGRLEHADALPERAADSDLNRPGHSGHERKEDGDAARGHGGEHNGADCATEAEERLFQQL